MTLLLDAGGFIAAESGNRNVVALIKRERRAGRAPSTHAGIVGQIWRGGSGRQVQLARLLGGVEVLPLDDALARKAGVLLGRTGTDDVLDSALVCIARDGDEILTSDVGDLVELAQAASVHIELIPA